jgi:S1-C subfamily serine protease
MARAVIRQASTLPSPEKLIPLLEAARKRLGTAPIASAAIDDALLALGGLTLSPQLLSRIVEMDKASVDALVVRLAESEPTDVALHVPALLDALSKKPALWSSLGPALVYAASHVRESTRVELRRATELVLDDLRHGKTLPPITLASVSWVLAKTIERGEALPRHLCLALDRVAAAEAAASLCALCARLAPEEAATVLLAMLRDPLPEARSAARDAVQSWQSPWVGIENDQIVPRYTDDKGGPLVRRGEKLVVALTDEEYVLDARGRPIRHGETEYGGCLCCGPARALVKRRGEGLRCPSTWESHLRDAGRTLFEKDHTFGRCTRCDSVRPRVRDGARIICIDCGAGIAAGDIAILPAPEQPPIPAEHRGGRDSEALPKPPTREELEHVAPHIRAAIAANVFLSARDGDERWAGSGIIIARDGNHIAILTNRHVVESDDRARLCAVDAMTVAGEATRVSCIWRAKRGVDLALVEARVDHPEQLGLMPLGGGVGLVGAEVFAIGNPLGLAWSYTAGTLSAVRHWTTREGQLLRILQTDTNLAPGSSGGGLFHKDGHLLGVISFLHQGHAGGSAHFALSIDAIREAFAREDVRWRDAPLATLSK